MLELHVKNTTVNSGSVPITWCVDKATLEALAALGARDVMLLLIVARKGVELGESRSNQDRYVVPLRDLMTFIGFSKPGEYRIFGRIIWTKAGSADPREWLLNHWGFNWRESLLKDCRWYRDWATRDPQPSFDEAVFTAGDLSTPELNITAELDLAVPAEVFAKEPPAWVKAWVNWMFKQDPVDQCAFRKRKWFFALPLQPLLFLFIYLFRLMLAAGALWAGFWKGLSFRPLYQPLQNDTEDIFTQCDESVFWLGDNQTQEPKQFFRFVLVPFFPIFVTAFWAVILMGPGVSEGVSLAVTLIVLGAISGILALIGVGRTLHWFAMRPEKLPLVVESAGGGTTPWFLAPQEVRFLACGTAPKPLRYAELPKERRTVRLLFQETKASVCRRYAR